MSDDDSNDQFDRMIENRYAEQAEVEYEPTPRYQNERKQQARKPVARKPAVKKPVAVIDSDDDDTLALSDAEEDLKNIEIETEMKERMEFIREKTDESKKLEGMRNKAIAAKLDPAKIAKVSRQISKLFFEIQEHEKWIERHGSSFKEKKEIGALEQTIEQLEAERANIEQQLENARTRLRKLKPYSAGDDYTNNPASAGFVKDNKGKWIASSTQDEEDDQESLARVIDARRKACQEAGEYNGETRGRQILRRANADDDTLF